MKVLIDIPQDHKRVIDNLVNDGKGYLLPQEVETRLTKAVKIGTVIPDNATNGDMIKMLFPNMETEYIDQKLIYPNGLYKSELKEEPYNTDEDNLVFVLRSLADWWNAPYKE